MLTCSSHILLYFKTRKAEDCKEDILREGSEARRYAVSLKGLAYGDQLVEELFQHSSHMEKLYETVTNLLASGYTKDSKYEKFIKVYSDKSAWFAKAKACLFFSFLLEFQVNYAPKWVC